MKFELHQLTEGPDELQVGDYVGCVWVEPEHLEVDVEDPELKSRLMLLLVEPMQLKTAAPHTLGTRVQEVYCGEPGYSEALRERLEKRDFRLLAEHVEEA